MLHAEGGAARLQPCKRAHRCGDVCCNDVICVRLAGVTQACLSGTRSYGTRTGPRWSLTPRSWPPSACIAKFQSTTAKSTIVTWWPGACNTEKEAATLDMGLAELSIQHAATPNPGALASGMAWASNEWHGTAAVAIVCRIIGSIFLEQLARHSPPLLPTFGQRLLWTELWSSGPERLWVEECLLGKCGTPTSEGCRRVVPDRPAGDAP